MLRIEKLNKSFGDRSVLKDLTLSIEPGEIYALLGADGAGKTATIDIICNLVKADSGSIAVNNQPVSEATKTGLYASILRQRSGVLATRIDGS